MASHLREGLPRRYKVLDDVEAFPKGLRGQHPRNPVNRPLNQGVQIELPPSIRFNKRAFGWSGFEGVPHTRALDRLIDALSQAVNARWKKIVNACVGLLLLSGLANFALFGVDKAKEVGSQYHMIFGIKFLAAMGVFFFVSALTGKSAALEGIRKNRGRWLAVTIALGVLVVLLAGYLNRMTPVE